jgi:hypothetical protein
MPCRWRHPARISVVVADVVKQRSCRSALAQALVSSPYDRRPRNILGYLDTKEVREESPTHLIHLDSDFAEDSEEFSFLTGAADSEVYPIIHGTLVSRIRDKERSRPYRMPLWPIPPIVTILGVGVALTQQTVRDMVIIVIIVVAALVYYYLYLHRAKNDKWISHTPVPEDLEAPEDLGAPEDYEKIEK